MFTNAPVCVYSQKSTSLATSQISQGQRTRSSFPPTPQHPRIALKVQQSCSSLADRVYEIGPIVLFATTKKSFSICICFQNVLVVTYDSSSPGVPLTTPTS